MDFKNVLFEKRGSIAFITLNRPEKRNPINISCPATMCTRIRW